MNSSQTTVNKFEQPHSLKQARSNIRINQKSARPLPKLRLKNKQPHSLKQARNRVSPIKEKEAAETAAMWKTCARRESVIQVLWIAVVNAHLNLLNLV
jgi:hypothetical protein